MAHDSSLVGWAMASFGLMIGGIVAVILAANAAWSIRDSLTLTQERAAAIDTSLENPLMQLNMSNCSALSRMVDDITEGGLFVPPPSGTDPDSAQLPYRSNEPPRGLVGIMPPGNTPGFPAFRVDDLAMFDRDEGTRVSASFGFHPCDIHGPWLRSSTTYGPGGSLAKIVRTRANEDPFICTHNWTTGATDYLAVTGLPGGSAPNLRNPIAYHPTFGWRICHSNQLWSIDPDTGVATDLPGGDTGGRCCWNGLAFAGDRLFSADATQGPAAICELDPVSGAQIYRDEMFDAFVSPPQMGGAPNVNRWNFLGLPTKDFYDGFGGWATAALAYDYDDDCLVIIGRYSTRSFMYYVKMSEMQNPMDSTTPIYLSKRLHERILNDIVYF